MAVPTVLTVPARVAPAEPIELGAAGGDLGVEANLADAVPEGLGEPEVAVRARRDVERLTAAQPVGNSVTTPAGVMRPMRLPVAAVLGEPEVAVGADGDADGARPRLSPVRNSVITPAGVMRPIASPVVLGEPELPSGPATMPAGWLAGGDPGRELGDRAGRRDPPDRGCSRPAR